jgi:hypothetical protein
MEQRRKTKLDRAAQLGVTHRSFSLWNCLFLLAGVVISVVFYFLGGLLFGGSPPQSQAAHGTDWVDTGPWGTLQITRIDLSRPEEYFEKDQAPPSAIRWFFSRPKASELAAFFSSIQLPEDYRQRLADTNRWDVSPAGVWIEPGMDLIRDLKPDARGRIYRLLSMRPENGAHRTPFQFRGEETKRQLSEAGLPRGRIELIEQLTYPRGGEVCFSDLDYLALTMTPGEMRKAAKILTRVPSLLVSLQITPESDIDALLEYWGTQAAEYKLKPLLKSLKRLPEGGDLDLSWFLPSVPKSLVQSYPHPAHMASEKYPDCFWTALNFFNETPTEFPLPEDFIRDQLMTEYHHVSRADQFGDLILFYERAGADIITIHLCVHLADDIVFTKNGYDPRQPWVIAPLKEVILLYGLDPSTQLAFLRRNVRGS